VPEPMNVKEPTPENTPDNAALPEAGF